jgi:hypothetical protein
VGREALKLSLGRGPYGEDLRVMGGGTCAGDQAILKTNSQGGMQRTRSWLPFDCRLVSGYDRRP